MTIFIILTITLAIIYDDVLDGTWDARRAEEKKKEEEEMKKKEEEKAMKAMMEWKD